MKKFWQYLREHTIKVINLKKKINKLLTNEWHESFENINICSICKNELEDNYAKDQKHCKVRDRCYYTGEYRGAAHIVYVIHKIFYLKNFP